MKWNLELELKRPTYTNISGNEFSMTRMGYIYEVTYRNEGKGILKYNYTKLKTQQRQTAETIVMAGVVVGLRLKGLGILVY